MPQQANLFSRDPDDPGRNSPVRRRVREQEAAPESGTPGSGMPRSSTPRPSRWLQRTELLVRVIVRLYLGLLITVLPWMRFWTENGLFSYSHGTAYLASSGFVRGLVSGLGLLNVFIAFQEMFASERAE